ncbi:hypothetical protein [Pseudoduganella umbonata]|uniref:Aldehyde dehydrogenase family protein n=1 Tax=Pseudoduganella umbonata TaxID=864828 RepID=A0A7W5HEB7_9BURK|nr:hypothetical protein [Pseudoduganella umbonata]MBB3223599.1 hypothetical protein [Pseudoduganella umbonata]
MSTATAAQVANPSTSPFQAPYFLSIGGQLASADTTFDVLNPATGKLLARAPAASIEQLDDAIAAPAPRSSPGPRSATSGASNTWKPMPTHSLRTATNWPACWCWNRASR